MMPLGKPRSRGGFTLLELMLVLVITAILSSLAVFTYRRFADKARFTQAQTALKHLQKTETIYFTENGRYSDNLVILDFDPTKYDYYQISVTLDNSAMNYVGYATGIRAMTGDLWVISTFDGNPRQDNTSTFR
jgi:prepilin-type N-terminal cleavage/methylation domain-containing protein